MSKIDFLKEQIIESRDFVNRLVSELPESLWSNSHIPLCPVSSFRAFSLNLKDFLKAVVRLYPA